MEFFCGPARKDYLLIHACLATAVKNRDLPGIILRVCRGSSLDSEQRVLGLEFISKAQCFSRVIVLEVHKRYCSKGICKKTLTNNITMKTVSHIAYLEFI